MKPTRRGLTLIELVLVVGIISILLSITWVGLSAFREKGRQVVCMNNLKQIGVALALYIHDYNGIAPALGARLEYWQLGLPPGIERLHPHYIKDFRVFLCPTRFVDYAWDTSKDTTHAYYQEYYWKFIPTYPDGVPMRAPFDEAISYCPDWPAVRCRAHGLYYGKEPAYSDFPFLGLFISSWKVKWFTMAELTACCARGEAILEGWLHQ